MKTPISPQQLPLTLTWPEHATFDSFVVGSNAQIFSHLNSLVNGEDVFCTYLYALNSGVGRTHLMQATCHAVTQTGNSAVYLSFKDTAYMPEILEGLESISLVCLDDIEQIAGQLKWETALFDLYHRLQDGQVNFLVSSAGLPQEIQWTLPDLKSRLSAADIFQIKSLSDEEKIIVLTQKAGVRGLQLSKEAGQYLLSHFPRDMHVLIDTLDILDRAALSAQRRLTVPFIKKVLVL